MCSRPVLSVHKCKGAGADVHGVSKPPGPVAGCALSSISKTPSTLKLRLMFDVGGRLNQKQPACAIGGRFWRDKAGEMVAARMNEVIIIQKGQGGMYAAAREMLGSAMARLCECQDSEGRSGIRGVWSQASFEKVALMCSRQRTAQT